MIEEPHCTVESQIILMYYTGCPLMNALADNSRAALTLVCLIFHLWMVPLFSLYFSLNCALQFDYLVREKIADGSLIAKWRKSGYEILCSMLAIQKGNHNFGTTSHCRVPLHLRSSQQRITPDVQTGCISCASGDGRFGGPIWWNTPLEEGAEDAEDNRCH